MAAALRSNEERLVVLGLDASVSHPGAGGYGVDDGGRPVLLPGMAGVCYNVRVGTPVFGWVGDHVEAGVSAGCEEPGRHLALQFLACVGNPVRVVSGPAAGAQGTVVGKHAYVLVDFPQDALDRLAPGDRLLVRACGQGLQLLDLPDVALRSLGPELLRALPLRLEQGVLRVAVAAELPAHMMGAGLGMSSEWANCDVMLTSRETVERLGLERLRIGDVVAMRDQDHRFGRGHRGGMCAIGVVAHGVGVIPGHGTGVITIMSGPAARFALEHDEQANVRDYLELPA
jgi:Domain of unknown function (DUF4438)